MPLLLSLSSSVTDRKARGFLIVSKKLIIECNSVEKPQKLSFLTEPSGVKNLFMAQEMRFFGFAS